MEIQIHRTVNVKYNKPKENDVLNLNGTEFPVSTYVINDKGRKVFFICHAGDSYIFDLVRYDDKLQEKMYQLQEAGYNVIYLYVKETKGQNPQLTYKACDNLTANQLIHYSMNLPAKDWMEVASEFKLLKDISPYWDSPQPVYYGN